MLTRSRDSVFIRSRDSVLTLAVFRTTYSSRVLKIKQWAAGGHFALFTDPRYSTLTFIPAIPWYSVL